MRIEPVLRAAPARLKGSQLMTPSFKNGLASGFSGYF
jgi:hypothetical protein